MRLASRITAALLLAFSTVLLVQSLAQLHRVAEQGRREAARDLALLARSVTETAGNLWSMYGEDGARRHVQSFDAEGRLRARVGRLEELELPLDLEALARAGGTGLEPLERGDELVILEPLGSREGGRTFLLLERSLGGQQRLLGEAIESTVLTAALALLFAWIASLVVGASVVGSRVRRMAAQVAGAADHRFERLRDEAKDELGWLSRKLDEAVDFLEAEHTRIEDERRARTWIFEHLRESDRVSTVGKLSAGLAHELGTPINVVMGRASMIASGDAAEEDAAENARIIVAQADRMAGIIRRLLSFSRPRGIGTTRTRVNAIVDQAVALMLPLAEGHGVEIERACGADVDAGIDRGRALQVLTNTIMNGIQAMPDGGRLTVGARAEHIEAPEDQRSSKGRYVCLFVEDRGAGMQTEDLSLLFDPFFAGSAEVGSGDLGLSVCHGIVREHGGWIEVRSEPGEGSCVMVYLPAGGE